MSRSHILPSLLAGVLIAGTAVSVALAERGSKAPSRSCGRRAAALRGRVAAAPRDRSGRAATMRVYDDRIGDVATAPDICGGNIVTNDNVSVTFGMHVHDRFAFEPFDSYSVLVDADSSDRTGAVTAGGAEFVIDVSGRTSALTVWNGSEFELAVPQPGIATGWVSAYGPVVQVEREALGDPRSFNVMFESRNGSDWDRAPDTGSWAYEVRPLELTAGKVSVGRARAGRPLRASMRVLRSDLDVPLSDGAVRCSASL